MRPATASRLTRCDLWLPLVALLIGGCTSSLPVYDGAVPAPERATRTPAAPGTNAVGAHVVEHALAMLGTPYRYGGATPRGFDCSGLVQYAYRQAGLDVPRTTEQQFRAARRVNRRDAEPGDLLFFRFTRSVSHVGIYLGGGQFVHAPTSGRSVEVMNLDQPYYRDNFVAVGRLHARL